MGLPNPPGILVKRLNKLFYTFLWKSCEDKRKHIIKDIEKGGLGMVHIDNFITALKVTWLRKMITHPDFLWSSLSSININRIFSMGENYAETKAKELNNPFWKDILCSQKIFCNSVPIEKVEHILFSLIWLNSNISQGQNLFIKKWPRKGIRNIIDLLDLNGQFYHFEDLKHNYNIQGTFLDYLSVLRRIPAIWKTKINQNHQVCQSLKHNIAQNYYIQILCSGKKGCR